MSKMADCRLLFLRQPADTTPSWCHQRRRRVNPQKPGARSHSDRALPASRVKHSRTRANTRCTVRSVPATSSLISLRHPHELLPFFVEAGHKTSSGQSLPIRVWRQVRPIGERCGSFG